MKKIYYLAFLVFTLTVSVTSCNKYESTAYEGLSTLEKESQLLTANPWVKTYTYNNLLNEDTIALGDCDKVVYTFLANRTVLYHLDANSCGGETNGSGTWSLSGDGKTLTIDGINSAIQITEDKLTLSMYHWDDDSLDETIFIPL
jgi:hypothetical protein